MGLFNLFKKSNEAITSYQDFWNWFITREQAFYSVVKNNNNIEKNFFKELSSKLNELRQGYYFLTGMLNADECELIITVDGSIKSIVFAEELLAVAPKLPNWKFTALKPATDIDSIEIQMGDYRYSGENLYFYSNEDAGRPDEINITVVYNDYNESDQEQINQGVFIFLDNFLGELAFTTSIDWVNVVGPSNDQKELVPIEKLKSFIQWREKEFIEKYEGIRHDTESDDYAILEATLGNGLPLVAAINTNLLTWDAKASHQWILNLEMKFNGINNNGMPDNETFALLSELEDEFMDKLKDYNGFLNIGRETAEGTRNVYFACNDFRNAAKITEEILNRYKDRIAMDYDIYKDKYWQSLDRFRIV